MTMASKPIHLDIVENLCAWQVIEDYPKSLDWLDIRDRLMFPLPIFILWEMFKMWNSSDDDKQTFFISTVNLQLQMIISIWRTWQVYVLYLQKCLQIENTLTK